MKHRYSLFIMLFALVIFVGGGCSNTANTNLGSAGLFVTGDKGETWESMASLPTPEGVQSIAGVSVYRLYEDPQDVDAIYWASRKFGLFYSYDSGTSWIQSAEPLNKGFVYSIAVHPRNKCILFATNGSRLYKSVDCSRTWDEVHREQRSGARISSLAFHGSEPYELFMTKANGDVLLSSDQGVSWAIASRVGAKIVHIHADDQSSDTLYLTTQRDGLFRSVDRGRTWTDISEGLREYPSSLEYRRFYVDPATDGHLYWVSTYGILESSDSGDTWEPLKLITSPGSADIYGFTINPDQPEEIYYTATINGRSIFYWSADGGVNWQTESLPSGQIPTVLRIHPEDRSQVYVGFTIPEEN